MSSRVDIADTGDAAGPEMRRNRWIFGVGTLGRDMAYTLVALYLVYYLTDVARRRMTRRCGAVTVGILLTIRVLDAILDPIVGAVWSTPPASRWGQFRPWLVTRWPPLWRVLTVVPLHRRATQLAPPSSSSSRLVNLLVGHQRGPANDISYWGMLPALLARAR
jgi:hypothetical protein